MFRSGKAAEALDLADMLLKALLSAHTIPLTQPVTDALRSIIGLVPPASAGLGLRFAKAAIRWATKDAPVDPAGVEGSAPPSTAVARRVDGSSPPSAAELRHRARVAQLHGAAARIAASAGSEHSADAQRHFLEADAPEEFAGEPRAVLAGYPSDVCTSLSSPPPPSPPLADFLHARAGEGYRTERDLFLARAVLQLLCLGNLRAANGVRDRFLSLDPGGATETPLGNFIRFLLLTLEVRRCEGGRLVSDLPHLAVARAARRAPPV